MKFAWSYSQLTGFETCPRRYYLMTVAKVVKEPESEQLRWGNRVHKGLENRVGKGTALPDSLKQYEPIAGQLLSKPGKIFAERRMAITASFQPTEWLAPDVWARSIMDVSIVNNDRMFVGDYKTGNPKPESSQLRMSAAMALHHHPQVQQIRTAFIWLKTNEVTVESIAREEIPEIWQELMPRVERLRLAKEANKFPPKPSGLCRKWCPVGKQHCEHCGE